MSEVNADGTLLNPHEAILQEVQALTNSLTAEEPEGMEDDKAHPVQAGNGQPAGEAGGAPHVSVSAALAAPSHRGAGTGSYAAEHPPQPAAGTRKNQSRLPPRQRGSRNSQNRRLTGGTEAWQTQTRWAWWRQEDWWGPLRPPTPW